VGDVDKCLENLRQLAEYVVRNCRRDIKGQRVLLKTARKNRKPDRALK